VHSETEHGWAFGQQFTVFDELDAEKGWLPKWLLRQVSLYVAVCEWVGEESLESECMLTVCRGDYVAIWREVEHGWVYGERVFPWLSDRQTCPEAGNKGWLPEKVLLPLRSA